MTEKIINFVRTNKKTALYVFVLVVGVILILISGSIFGDAEEEHSAKTDYEERLCEELEKLCSSVDGVGRCRVYVTFSRGEQNTYKGSNLVETRPPKVEGVTVVCRGADSERVEAELCEMISALFGIGYNRIAILKLNS